MRYTCRLWLMLGGIYCLLEIGNGAVYGLGVMRVDGGQAMRIASTRVEIDIVGRIAVTRFNQTFRNDTGSTVGFYELELPPGAVITDLALWVGQQRVPAYVVRNGASARAYAVIQARGTRPARLLPAQDGTDQLVMTVAPFPRSDQRRVEVEYMELLHFADGQGIYCLPMGAGRGYVTGQLAVSGRVRGTGVRIEPLASGTARQVNNLLAFFDYEASNAVLDRDFELAITNQSPLPYILSWAPVDRREWGYYALWASLPDDLPQDKLVAPTTVFIVDRGLQREVFTTVQSALVAAVARMRLPGRFNLLFTGSELDAMDTVPQEASNTARGRALRFIAAQQPGVPQQPDLETALGQVLASGFGGSRVNEVVLVLGPEARIDAATADRLRQMVEAVAEPVRLFVVGIDVPHAAARGLRRLVDGWGEEAVFIGAARVGAVMGRFGRSALPFARMEVDGIVTRDVLPKRPAYWLRPGEDFFQTGRYRGVGPVRIALTDNEDQNLLQFDGLHDLSPSEDPEFAYEDGDVLLFEDFNDGSADGWSYVPRGMWQVDRGRGILQQKRGKAIYRSFVSVPASDYTIEVRMRINEPGEEGKIILTRAHEWEDWRLDFFGGSDHIRLINHRLGQHSSKAPLIIQTGVWYDIRVEVGDGLVQTHINDQPVHLRIPLGTPPDGNIGLGSYKTGQTEFDYVLVKAGISSEADVLPVSIDEEAHVDAPIQAVAYLQRLWGWHRLQEVERQARIDGVHDAEVLRELGLKYRLLTPQTSMVVPGDQNAAGRMVAQTTEDSTGLGRDAARDAGPSPLTNHPNPFNASTVLQVQLGQSDEAVRLEVFNAAGQKVRVLHQGALAAGTHRFAWDGLDRDGAAVGSGVYLARFEGGGRTAVRRMLLLR